MKTAHIIDHPSKSNKIESIINNKKLYFGTKLDISGENTLIIIFASFLLTRKK